MLDVNGDAKEYFKAIFSYITIDKGIYNKMLTKCLYFNCLVLV